MEIYFVHLTPFNEPATTTTTTNGDEMNCDCDNDLDTLDDRIDLLTQRIDSLENLILDLAEHLKVNVEVRLPSDVTTFEITGNKKRS